MNKFKKSKKLKAVGHIFWTHQQNDFPDREAVKSDPKLFPK